MSRATARREDRSITKGRGGSLLVGDDFEVLTHYPRPGRGGKGLPSFKEKRGDGGQREAFPQQSPQSCSSHQQLPLAQGPLPQEQAPSCGPAPSCQECWQPGHVAPAPVPPSPKQFQTIPACVIGSQVTEASCEQECCPLPFQTPLLRLGTGERRPLETCVSTGKPHTGSTTTLSNHQHLRAAPAGRVPPQASRVS